MQPTVDNGEANYTNFGGGLAFGHQWITISGFAIDFFFGGHYGNGNLDVASSSGTSNFDTYKFEGFHTRVGFAPGFAS